MNKNLLIITLIALYLGVINCNSLQFELQQSSEQNYDEQIINANSTIDFIIGNHTNYSFPNFVNVFSPFNTTSISLQLSVNQTIISIEAINRNRNGTGGSVSSVEGGIGQNWAIIHFQSNFSLGIEFNLTVWSEFQRNDFIIGQLTSGSGLLHNEVVFVPAGLSGQVVQGVFSYSNIMNVTRVVALDQNYNGTGGFVNFYTGGINDSFVNLYFLSQPGNGIHFIVSVYGEVGNNYEFGTITPNSVLLFRRFVSVPSRVGQIVYASTSFDAGTFHNISRIESRGLNGTGGQLISMGGGIGGNNVTINLQSVQIGVGINVLINIFGNTQVFSNDFRQGMVTDLCTVLHQQRVLVNAQTGAIVTGSVYYSSPNRTITMIQGINGYSFGTGGILATQSGGVGTQSVTLIFQSVMPGQPIDFTVSIYGN